MVPMPQNAGGRRDEGGSYLFALWSLWHHLSDGRGASLAYGMGGLLT